MGGAPEDPYEKYKKYRIEGVDPDPQKNKQRKKFQEKPLASGSFFFILFYKMLDYLISIGGKGLSNKSEKEVRQDLYHLKAAFETMKLEDHSQDIPFLNRLSEIWHHALEISLRFKRTHAFSVAFQSFVRNIQNYPEGEEHTLGYYLSEYTGEKWLPFPYMELIQKIHEQYKSNPTESPLALWIQELDELISSLQD